MPSPACPHDGCICQPLTTARRGDRVIVRHLHGDDGDCLRLREMGIQERAELKMICGGGPVIAQVHGARVCLSHRMAEAVLIVPA